MMFNIDDHFNRSVYVRKCTQFGLLVCVSGPMSVCTCLHVCKLKLREVASEFHIAGCLFKLTVCFADIKLNGLRKEGTGVNHRQHTDTHTHTHARTRNHAPTHDCVPQLLL